MNSLTGCRDLTPTPHLWLPTKSALAISSIAVLRTSRLASLAAPLAAVRITTSRSQSCHSLPRRKLSRVVAAANLRRTGFSPAVPGCARPGAG